MEAEGRTSRMRYRVLLAACGVVALAALVHPGGARAEPTLLVRSGLPIYDMSASAKRLAWVMGDYATGPCAVRSRPLARRVVRTLVPCRGSGLHTVAVAGRRTFLASFVDVLSGEDSYSVTYAFVVEADGRTRSFGSRYGELVGAVAAGSRSAIVYGITENVRKDWACEGAAPTGPCHFSPEGSVFRVGRKREKLPAPPAALVDVAGSRLALVPAAEVVSYDAPLDPVPSEVVEIRTLPSGALARRIETGDELRAMALDESSVAALLVAEDGSKRIDRWDAASGELLGTYPVPRATAALLDLDAGRIVYRVRTEIRLLDASGGERAVWTGRQVPLALSFAGRRLVWAINRVDERGRIFSLRLPRDEG